MIFSFAACKIDDGADTKDPTQSPEIIAGVTKKDYGKTFNILYPTSGTYIKYLFSEENTGETMSAALFNREINNRFRQRLVESQGKRKSRGGREEVLRSFRLYAQ